jgi:3'-phosphoadenosine 5'-phosphosulfate sulfotransferase (PAPS reductase)/FAD synthetase
VDDPALHPRLDGPTPAAAVARLTAQQRVDRVWRLIDQARDIIDMALREHLGDRELVGKVVLFSGGNDSTVLLHLVSHLGRANLYAAHANTTVGIEETRVFVRQTCAQMDIPLLEKYPPKTYEELILEEIDGAPRGFPGPGQHYFYFQRLKERALRKVRKQLVTRPRKQRVMFIAGRRRAESKRRGSFKSSTGESQVPLYEAEGSIIWCSPLANWTKLDMTTYRIMMQAAGDPVPVNEVSDLLHMSGECLCGCFSKEQELEEIRMWFPRTAEFIDTLMEKVAAAGVTGLHAIWGHGKGRPTKRKGMLCEDCQPTLW